MTSLNKKRRRKIGAIILSAAVFCSILTTVQSRWSTSASSAYTVANVQRFGAKGDGFTDDSSAVLKAISAVKSCKGTVFFPAGLYRITKGLTVPKGVTLEGVTTATTGPWQNYLDIGDKGGINPFGGGSGAIWIDADSIKGSWILAENNIGNVNGTPTFSLDGGCKVTKLGFINKSQAPASNIVLEAPPLISVNTSRMTDFSSPITLSDISLPNCYIGIAITQGSQPENDYLGKSPSKSKTGKITIEDIMGAPAYKGIMVKGISSEVVMNNLQFNYSCYNSAHVSARMGGATDVELAAASNVSITNMLTFGANYGIVTKPAYNTRTVTLKATDINLEARIPMDLQASGSYSINTAYLFTIDFANGASSKEHRCLKLKSDSTSSAKSTYKFTNVVLQNPYYSDAAVSDTNVELVVNSPADIDFENVQNLGWDSTGKEPIISYTHNSGSGSSCTFSNFNIVGANSNPVIKTGGSSYQSGEVSFVSSRFPKDMSFPYGDAVHFIDCTKFSGQSNTYFNVK